MTISWRTTFAYRRNINKNNLKELNFLAALRTPREFFCRASMSSRSYIRDPSGMGLFGTFLLFSELQRGIQLHMEHRSCSKRQPHTDQNFIQYIYITLKNFFFFFFFKKQTLVTSRLEPRSASNEKAFVKGWLCTSLCEALSQRRQNGSVSFAGQNPSCATELQQMLDD